MMKRAIVLVTALTVVAIGGTALWAVAKGKGSNCSHDPGSAARGTEAVAAGPSGRVLGHFDLAMAGCRFACATQAQYDGESVVAQPGARDGDLAQCPVSGVVFSVDAGRPHVRVGTDDYVTCCDTCAKKLRGNPRRFVRT